MYHVVNRGGRREDIYPDAQDRVCFPETPGRAGGKTGWQVHACCLEFERRMEGRRVAEESEEAAEALRRGWCLGSVEFKARMLERMEGELGEHHSGQQHLETARAKAERIIAEEMARLGWDADQLTVRRKNDPGKLGIAARLRRETTLSLKDIAQRVGLGSSKSANATLHRWMSREGAGPRDLRELGI